MGLREADQVSKAEAFKHWPSMRTLLLYSILYDAPIPSIIPSYMEELEAEIAQKARLLQRRLAYRRRTRQLDRRLATVKRLAALTRS